MRRSLVRLASSLALAMLPAACSGAPATADADPFAVQRERMVAEQIEARWRAAPGLDFGEANHEIMACLRPEISGHFVT